MEKKGRSFLVCFIILILAAGAVFFIGWTQFRVDTDSVGVLVSKTGGVSTRLIKSGEFSWHWEFLLPTNAKLKVFSIVPYSFRQEISGVLPSGDVYSNLFKASPDFSYNFDFTIFLSISEDGLLSLVKEGRVEDQDALEDYLRSASEVVVKNAVNNIISNRNEKQPLIGELVDYSRFFDDIDISKRFPDVSIEKIDVHSVKIPDFDLYERTREIYLEKLRSSLNAASFFAETQTTLSAPEKTDGASDAPAIDEKKVLELLDQLKSILQLEGR
ncbi:MAG: hypothetical protein HDR34_08040 [Treponema sp.]|nr:hypothetical protein [Treponema sp.]